MRNIIRFSMIITIISFLIISYWKPKDFLLIVAIISSPENFKSREIIRNTWLRNINPNLIKSFFFIGDSLCDVPPSDRADYYSCERINFNMKLGDIEDYMNFTTAKINTEKKTTKVIVGFLFRNFHKIKVTHLGISTILLRHAKKIKVSLLEATSNQHVVSTVFLRSEASNSSKVEIKEVDAYLLPKYFEGKLILETTQPFPENIPCFINWDSGKNIIHFNQVLLSLHEMPLLFDETYCPPIFFSFDLEEIAELRAQITSMHYRQIQYKSYVRQVKHKIFQEAAKYNDVVLLDMLDIYRHLPAKLLKLSKWLCTNLRFKYLLKTDDDVFININRVVDDVNGLGENRLGWWAALREGWPVHVTGKWRELYYRAPHYPPFPCGAAYVLNHRLVEYLANNEHLFLNYQGEDVSLGIWLSAINPDLYHGTYQWSCDKYCRKDSYNRAEITPSQMNESYQALQRCGNMCGCDTYPSMENKWI